MVWIFASQTREVSGSVRKSTAYLSFRVLLLSGTFSLMKRWRFLLTSSICRLAGLGFLCWVPAYLWRALAKEADG